VILYRRSPTIEAGGVIMRELIYPLVAVWLLPFLCLTIMAMTTPTGSVWFWVVLALVFAASLVASVRVLRATH
jgi:hypothetical protein